ncbi:MAG TPA: hypothetical protein VH500_16390 [Nitrososphaeraceae archaeon]|jgi:hypothetical protein
MNNTCFKRSALVVASVIAALTISPTLVTDHLVKAADTSVGKSLQCDSSKHTKNYCDGFTVGKTDCRDGRKYDGNNPSHTNDWKGGYRAGWTGAGCHVP